MNKFFMILVPALVVLSQNVYAGSDDEIARGEERGRGHEGEHRGGERNFNSNEFRHNEGNFNQANFRHDNVNVNQNNFRREGGEWNHGENWNGGGVAPVIVPVNNNPVIVPVNQDDTPYYQ